jgi:hypothetical protein
LEELGLHALYIVLSGPYVKSWRHFVETDAYDRVLCQLVLFDKNQTSHLGYEGSAEAQGSAAPEVGDRRSPRVTEEKIFLVEDDRYVICMNLFRKWGGFDWSMGCKLSGYSLAYRGYWSSEGRRFRSNAYTAVPDDGTNFEDTHCKRKVLQARRSVLERASRLQQSSV